MLYDAVHAGSVLRWFRCLRLNRLASSTSEIIAQMLYVSNNVWEVGLYYEFSSLITPTAAVLDYKVTAEYEHVRQIVSWACFEQFIKSIV